MSTPYFESHKETIDNTRSVGEMLCSKMSVDKRHVSQKIANFKKSRKTHNSENLSKKTLVGENSGNEISIC